MRSIQFWLASTALILGVHTANAAESSASTEVIPSHPLLSDELILTLGAFYPRSNTTAALGPSGGGSGVAIDFEDTLDLEKRTLTPTASVFWRASENWRVEFDYFEVSRDATRTLATDIQWGDLTFTAGSTVNSTFDFSDLRLSAVYSIFKRRDKELGAGLGVHVSGIKASIASSGTGADSADVTAPLPVVNIYGMFALTNKWAVDMRADWLSLTYGDYSGDVRNMAINLLYQPYRHVGFGVGMRNLVIDVDMDSPDWNGKARLSFQGPAAFMTVSF